MYFTDLHFSLIKPRFSFSLYGLMLLHKKHAKAMITYKRDHHN